MYLPSRNIPVFFVEYALIVKKNGLLAKKSRHYAKLRDIKTYCPLTTTIRHELRSPSFPSSSSPSSSSFPSFCLFCNLSFLSCYLLVPFGGHR